MAMPYPIVEPQLSSSFTFVGSESRGHFNKSRLGVSKTKKKLA